MKPSFKTIIRLAALAGVTSALINAVLFFLFNALGIISNTVFVQENQPLTVIPVLIASLLPSLLAGVVFFLLCRYTYKGYRVFSIAAIVLLLLSFSNPFIGIPGIPIGMAIALILMHIVVVGSLLYFFRRIKGSEVNVAL